MFEWFVFSAVLIAAVTLIYVYVLSKSAPPEKLTEMKLETIHSTADASNLLASAEAALRSGDFRTSIDNAVKASALTLINLLDNAEANHANMNVSDLAYLVQARHSQLPDMIQHVYNLNLLRLKAVQGQPLTTQEVEWALSTVNWLIQLAEKGRIRP
jgi:hypothetical protein